MRRTIQAIIWLLNRIVKIPGNILSFLIRCFVPVQKGVIICWAYNFKQYSCNPKYLSEYILDNENDYKIYWVFRSNKYAKRLDKRIEYVKFRSWKYFKLINSAEFLITNLRTDPYRIYWHKRPEQKYLMLWHGGVALKKIEKDAEKKLGYGYVVKAKIDSKICDLMISGCKNQTTLLQEKFWYSGNILERGIPRNDIFFNTELHKQLREEICKQYRIPADNRIVLYAPTFRRNRSIKPYNIDWNKVLPHIRNLFKNENITVFIRLHPNLINKVDTSPLINNNNIIDATMYHDMQELLCISDMLITDYSSSMFDFTMQGRPCILYATDIEKYDRGYYFKFDELPYPVARTQEELIEIIATFDNEEYKAKLQKFLDENIGLFEKGDASAAITEWIKEHSLK
ncbi:MAG: CDP-glycerol glycerophosphotransferase family protein [Bacteroidaceae bacterium]|nr:CDP-glycerol glycerophosphotransferase family protein [Bacteroidaceae bacterium]